MRVCDVEYQGTKQSRERKGREGAKAHAFSLKKKTAHFVMSNCHRALAEAAVARRALARDTAGRGLPQHTPDTRRRRARRPQGCGHQRGRAFGRYRGAASADGEQNSNGLAVRPESKRKCMHSMQPAIIVRGFLGVELDVAPVLKRKASYALFNRPDQLTVSHCGKNGEDECNNVVSKSLSNNLNIEGPIAGVDHVTDAISLSHIWLTPTSWNVGVHMPPIRDQSRRARQTPSADMGRANNCGREKYTEARRSKSEEWAWGPFLGGNFIEKCIDEYTGREEVRNHKKKELGRKMRGMQRKRPKEVDDTGENPLRKYDRHKTLGGNKSEKRGIRENNDDEQEERENGNTPAVRIKSTT
ncbi:hypothetical protein DFH11DRAFT_1539716 [Phellopilus nigrolimitatus]|nr:hypothetical protein DFH11DRAFT_1539716 [Phellopilus nigrolimitatus]